MQKIRFFFELFAHSETQKLRINLATSYSVWTFRRRKNPFLWLPSSKISQLETHPLFPSPPLLFSPKKNFFTMFSFHLAPQIRRSKILSTCLYTPYMYASTLFIIVALGNGASAAVSKKIAPRAIWCGPNFTWNKSRYEKKKDFSGDRKSRHPNPYLFHSLRASSVISRLVRWTLKVNGVRERRSNFELWTLTAKISNWTWTDRYFWIFGVHFLRSKFKCQNALCFFLKVHFLKTLLKNVGGTCIFTCYPPTVKNWTEIAIFELLPLNFWTWTRTEG